MMSSCFLAVTSVSSISLCPFVEKQDNKPLHHIRLVVAVSRAALELLPQGTAINIIYTSMPLY